MEIQHFSHHHPLIPIIVKNDDREAEDKCSACELPIATSCARYGCLQCKFVIHKSCAELGKNIQHPFHTIHPLTFLKKNPNDFKNHLCNACGSYRFGFIFRCAKCHFDLCGRCSSLVATVRYETHDHLLAPFVMDSSSRRLNCSCCLDDLKCGDSCFRCLECEFNLHKSCFELPEQIQHSFHSLHALNLIRDKTVDEWGVYHCNACQKSCRGFVFRCEDCDFDLHPECVQLVPTLKYEGHDHLLTFFNEIHGEAPQCNYCDKDCHESVFRCVECNFNVHKLCTELEHIQHPFHPPHPLTLVHESRAFHCNACRKQGYGLVFRCEKCNFDLDTECASSLEADIEYEGHDHLLTFFNMIYDKDAVCISCHTPCDTLVLRCVECDFNIHALCTGLQKQIQHPFHPLHPLTFGNHENDGDGDDDPKCKACNYYLWEGDPFYRCQKCDFNLDVGCTSLIPNIKSEGHHHLLTLFDEIKYYGKPLCSICNTSYDDTLRCVECDFNLHKQCTILPEQILHPFHPLHPLVHIKHEGDSWRCSACKNWKWDAEVFRCEDCNFNLDTQCALLIPAIKYEHHDHLLNLFKIKISERGKGLPCNCCDNPCDAFFLRCVRCDFNLRIGCAPSLIPHIIKHECHIDPLTFTNTVVVDEQYDEFYCDACEKERNPNDPVYYCAECPFIAHISCVMSEVLPSLIEKQQCDITEETTKIKPASFKLENEIQRLRIEVEEQEDNTGELLSEVEAKKEEIEKLHTKVGAGREELEAQKKELQAQTNELKALKEKLEALEELTLE